ncbi:betaine-aldehyde dehydrogenase [Oceanicola sp. 22II-s10i]|uniref:betaine-aldehyde dehydrogenase n=1 Tax=Oceanicola sp. 22II-s10i TaxID=1317116 RepID=UPI000B51F2C4|nr:betaine-aldehyde dehydrogenase [Oceanicola sp. 22II-s10i]
MRAQPPASHFIGGAYREDAAVTPVPDRYPFDGSVIAEIRPATRADVNLAFESAQEAQKKWAALPPVERGRVLRRAADIIRSRNEDLSELETLDTGKPIQETLVADASSGADALEFFGGIATTLNGEMIPLGDDWAYTRREPLGVCVGIGAWNYPIQIACWKAAPALAAGNAMIFKPSEETPLTALKLAEILVEAGAPAGLFNVVQGAGDVGAMLVTDSRCAKVSLTGSVPTGRKVYAAAAEGIRHVTMELGGKSPLIVFEDADIDNAVSAAINANFYSSGQICSNGTRVFVAKPILSAFCERLTERTANAVLGDPLDPATTIGPIINRRQKDQILAAIAKGKAAGAELLFGGEDGEGLFVPPTAFAAVSDDMALATDEIFGPVMSILSFEDEEEVITRANATDFGLAAGVFTADLTRAHRVVARLEAGTCWINTYNLTPVEMPFGGMKMSGVGRENARAALDHYTQVKTVYVCMGDVEAPF